MRILYKPKVYLVSGPSIREEGFLQFLEDNGLRWPTPREGVKSSELLVELAGRCCYMSFGNKAGSKTNEAYIRNLLGRNPDGSFKPGPAHGSVTEHPCWSFLVTGASRGFSHEQVRHRVGTAYSQLSTRYCDFEREEEEGTWDPGFVVPPLAQLSDRTREHFEESYRIAVDRYKTGLHLVEEDLQAQEQFVANLADKEPRERARALRKAARGAAREQLPIAAEAIMTMSFNARAIWNMAYLRASEHAEAAIRDVFCQIVNIMEGEMPALFNAIVYKEVWDGSQAVELPRDKL
jgi:thymidylate synthase (FAD)